MSKVLKYTLYGILILDIVGVIATLIWGSTLLSDDFEHLQMSYLVSEGKIPYIDFFEHHHPFLWYVFAPLMKVLPHDIIFVLYFARFFSLSFRVLMFYIIYLMFKRFFGDSRLFLYFLIMIFSFYPIWYGASYFKPDIFEQLFFFAGLYFFFAFIRDFKRYYLTICGLCFTVSFLFLQTAIFKILPLVIPLAIMINRDKKVIKDTIIAILPSLLLISSYLLYLCYTGAWERYYELNWIFNLHVFRLCDTYIGYSSAAISFIIQLLSGCFAFMWLRKNKKSNIYIDIIGLLYFCSVIGLLFHKVTDAHYMMITFIYCAMLISFVLKYLLQSRDSRMFCFKMLAILYFLVLFVMNCTTLYLWNNFAFFNLIDSKKQDIYEVGINIDNIYPRIYGKQISYYVMRRNLSKVDNYLFGKYPEYDINEIIKEYKPKYLDYRKRESEPIIKNSRFEIMPEVLQDYEQIYPNLWQRKDTISQ